MKLNENLEDSHRLAAVADQARMKETQEIETVAGLSIPKQKVLKEQLQRELAVARKEYNAAREQLGAIHAKLRLVSRDYVDGDLVDWDENMRRAQRLKRLIKQAGIRQSELSAHVGVSVGHVTRVLSGLRVRLGENLEQKLERGVTELLEHHRSQYIIERQKR